MSGGQEFDLSTGAAPESPEERSARLLREVAEQIARDPNAAKRRQMRKRAGGALGIEWRVQGCTRIGWKRRSAASIFRETGHKPTLGEVLSAHRESKKR